LTFLTKIYRCDVQNQLDITLEHSRVITSANGTHKPDESNDDVACFASYGNNVHYFPQNLQNVFKNLKRISIQEGRLKEINQVDLKPFPQLAELLLANNDLIVLENGVFEYNIELMLIDLFQNKIIHIGQNVFEGLTKLNFLDIRSNASNAGQCINMIAENNLLALHEVIGQAKSNCTNPEFVAIEAGLKALEDEYEFVMNETYEAFGEKVMKFRENYKNSSFMSLSSVNETISLFLDIDAQPMWIMSRKMKQLEKTMMESNRIMMKKIEGMEKKPNLMEMATSDFSKWTIIVVISIVAMAVVYKKAFYHYRFPIMMI